MIQNKSRALPPRLSPEEIVARKEMREKQDAEMRGVVSIAAMRDAIRAASRSLPTLHEIPRLAAGDQAAFEAQARHGMPFILTGLVGSWPISRLTLAMLRQRHGDAPVRARVGDYINTAFALDRAMQDMSLAQYLDLVDSHGPHLPPYVGNLALGALNPLCHWPNYFKKMGPPRYWIGPAGTVTPLHCDYDDNVFAQIWGRKRVTLAPPHHDEFLYPREANAMLFGSPFDPEAPDFERFPLARNASIVDCIMEPGELLYLPAGWYHQVRGLAFSLSVNRWARGVPLVLSD